MRRFLAQGLASGIRTIPAVTLLALLASPEAIAAASGAGQLAFATPEQAVDALLSALRKGQTDVILRILGPNSRSLVVSGDDVADTRARQKLLAALDTMRKIERPTDDHAILVAGEDDRVFPLTIVKIGNAWRFDDRARAIDIPLPQAPLGTRSSIGP